MKRYSANQIRMFWHVMSIAVIASGCFGVWIIPGVDVSAVSSAVRSTHPEDEAATPPQPNDRVTRKDIDAFLSSLPRDPLSPDPFLSAGELEWKSYLENLKDRPPHLEGILTVNGARVALMRGARLAPGDTIEGFTITSIDEATVHLTRGDAAYTLNLR